jgi:hypothetical protein
MSVEQRVEFNHQAEIVSPELMCTILHRLPALYDVPIITRDDQKVIEQPKSFDEIFSHQKEFQDYKAVLRRGSQLQESLTNNIEIINKLDINPLETYINAYLSVNSILLARNNYPYEIPSDTRHLLAWYKDGTPPEKIAEYLSKKFTQYRVGTNDFVIYKNISTRRSVPTIDHLQILVRR